MHRTRIRQLLHPVQPPAPDPQPHPDDWWTRLYDQAPADTHQPHPDAQPPMTTVTVTVPSAPEYDQGLDPVRLHRGRQLLYNGAAAGAGWGIGLGPLMSTAIHQCGAASASGGVTLGLGIALIAAVPDWYLRDARRSHHGLGLLLGWLARIPLATAALALALYAPGTLT